MNSAQRIILIIGAVLILIMTALPPWNYAYHREKLETTSFQATNGQVVKISGQRSAGFHFIFSTPYVAEPQVPGWDAQSEWVEIDKSRLAVQLTGTLIITGLLFLAVRRLNP